MKTNYFSIEDNWFLKLTSLKVNDSMLKKNKCINTLKKYGFVEISELIHYINSIEGTYIDSWEAKFVLDRVSYCLERYGDEDEYFCSLKSLALQLKNLI